MAAGYDYDELFPGRFLKAGELKERDVTLQIAAVEIEEMPDEQGSKVNKEGKRVKVRGILSFDKTSRQLVINRTNGESLKAMFGRKTMDWVGKRVTLYPAIVESFGEQVPAIRVRGSPDLPSDLVAELQVGRKTRKATFKRTGAASKQSAAAAPVAPPAPAVELDDDLGGDDLQAGEAA